jgi:thiol-disulfide isomerase/thioredoxin
MSKTQTKKQASNRNLIFWVGGGVIGLGLIFLLALSIAGEPEVDTSIAFGEVTVEGESLPFFADPSAADPALGLTAPTVSGGDWMGNDFTISPDGRPKILVLLAHWCPHCQAEVPRIVEWIDSGGLPAQVDLYGLTVLTNRVRDGSTWPPQDWLEREGWTSPVIMDNEEGSVVSAFGLVSTPLYVVLDGENKNLGRFSGEVGTSGLVTMANLALSSLEG